ncbi:hypothetical protein EBR21_15875 [bacterium]|nr:hypothetical protein [bacterium]
MTSDARLANRLKTAAGLWERYVDAPAPRQLDRWLSEAMRAEKRFGSQDRRFYSNVLFSAARLVSKAIFEADARESLHRFLGRPASEQLMVLNRFTADVSTEAKLWERIRNFSALNLIEASNNFLEQASSGQPEIELIERIFRDKSSLDESDFQLLLIANGIPPAWSSALMNRVGKSQWSRAQLFDFLRQQNLRRHSGFV